jgi:aspartate kinase
MALMSMALNDAGCPALSFTGSQSGVMTDGSHSNARIVDIKPTRIDAALAAGKCAVIAGFQGVSPETKEITTLGRGGSDVTAVALAARFSAERCEILKDVDGVYSADPREVPGARHLPELSSQALLEMTFWGAKVLHYRSVELAHALAMPIVVGLAHEASTADAEAGSSSSTPPGSAKAGARHTLVKAIAPEATMYEQSRVLSVNAHKEARFVRIDQPNAGLALAEFEAALLSESLPWPQLLHAEERSGQGAWSFLIAAPAETLEAISRLARARPGFAFEEGAWATVTATCQGAYASGLAREIAGALAASRVVARHLLFAPMSVTAVVASGDRIAAERALHALASA